MESVTGCRPSDGLLRRVQADLDERAKAFKERLISKRYVYLFVDAAWVKDIVGERAGRICILTAIGVTETGEKEILGFRRAPRENESVWRGFLIDLVSRGLHIPSLRLVVSDEHKGLLAAVSEVLGDVDHQLCWAHRCRNIYEAVQKCDRRAIVASLRSIYRAPHLSAAREALRTARLTWEAKYPAIFAKLEEDMRYWQPFSRSQLTTGGI
jgi:transposase-like protein